MRAWWLVLGVGCASPPSTVEVVTVEAGLEVRSGEPIARVDVFDAAGRRLVTRAVPAPTDRVWVPIAEVERAERVRVVTAVGNERDGVWRPADAEPMADESAVPQIAVVGQVFPADAAGRPLPAAAVDRIELPAPLIAAVRDALGGWSARDAALAYEAVTLRNDGGAPVDVVVEASVVDGADRPVAAFRPVVRDARGLDRVAVLVRVPGGGSAVAALPIHCDRATVAAGAYRRTVRVTALETGDPLATAERPLVVRKGRDTVVGGLAVAVVAAVAGWTLVFARARSTLRRMGSSDLGIIATFSALQFAAAAAGVGLSTAAVAVLGPFAPFLTGVFDEGLRAALMAGLVTLVPRPGAVGLSLLLGFVLRAVTFGALGPGEVMYTGAAIFWTEIALFSAGLTRDLRWRDGSLGARRLRLGLGLALASALTAWTGFAVHRALYRLFYSDAFVAAMVLGPSGVYVLVSAVASARFVDSLRRVER